ncbi:MAG TPA: AraC family transcriptional regulator [Janthinobacterium sp.]|nr:AraC family transcriptional regulator [Janthinobacterium sp.]
MTSHAILVPESRLDIRPGAAPMLLLPQMASSATGKALHSHPEGQLYLALQGLIVIEAGAVRSVLPPGRMGWVPPGVVHGASAYVGKAPDGMVGLNLYLKAGLCRQLPAEPVVLHASPLLRAVLARMREWPPGQALDARAARLLGVLIDELGAAVPDPLRLVMPRHPRLARLAAAILADPAEDTSLDEWAGQLAMSRRSITRHFRAETGMSLLEWRQMARLQRGMELLNGGGAVTTVAMTLGYDSVSSFIALFRRMLGTTPAKFAAQ